MAERASDLSLLIRLARSLPEDLFYKRQITYSRISWRATCGRPELFCSSYWVLRISAAEEMSTSSTTQGQMGKWELPAYYT